jgi:hypothetical protein
LNQNHALSESLPIQPGPKTLSGGPGSADVLGAKANRVDFLFDLARNERLVAEIAPHLAKAAAEGVASGKPARRFRDFPSGRAKAGAATWLPGARTEAGASNPRFVVTSAITPPPPGRAPSQSAAPAPCPDDAADGGAVIYLMVLQ